MKITAAVVREKAQPFTIEELELDNPQADEVLVRIVATGLCHTDLIVRDQYYPVALPAVLGHEGAGIVEQVGDRITKVKPGDRVVLSYLSCGHCVNCQTGHLSYCHQFSICNLGGVRFDGSTTLHKNGQVIYGNFFAQSSFATYALAKERNIVKVREDVPLELLGPLGCGIQTGAGAVLNSLDAEMGSSIAIFGAGSVGLSAVMAAVIAGCTTIIAIDLNPKRLQMAKELGATHVINAGETNPVESILQMTDSGVNYSLETTGLPQVFRQAVDSLTRLGVCGLIGATPLGTEVTFDMNHILSGRMIRGILEGDSIPDLFIPQLIELYLQGRFPFDRLITFYNLEQINQAAEDSEQGRVIKPVLRMPA
ncbi:MAG: NAD(P)-dependent alcohol dehydrogenase [Cyanobacteriota bacterium]